MSNLSIANPIKDESGTSTKSGSWSCNQDVKEENIIPIVGLKPILYFRVQSVTTSISDPSLLEQLVHDNVVTFTTKTKKLFISDLGWTREQIIETRSRLKTFEEDWNMPEMDIYDEL